MHTHVNVTSGMKFETQIADLFKLPHLVTCFEFLKCFSYDTGKQCRHPSVGNVMYIITIVSTSLFCQVECFYLNVFQMLKILKWIYSSWLPFTLHNAIISSIN